MTERLELRKRELRRRASMKFDYADVLAEEDHILLAIRVRKSARLLARKAYAAAKKVRHRAMSGNQ